MKKNEKKMMPFDLLDARTKCGILRKDISELIGVSSHLLRKYEDAQELPEEVYNRLKERVPQWFTDTEREETCESGNNVIETRD